MAGAGLPARYDVIVLRDGHPRTKPRALNAGLEVARGSLAVVYDAEDRPDPGQLRAAARRFAAGPERLACLQARLAIDHTDETWITRLFALEYAALFGAVKPGLVRLGLPVPLGGTSNHFRVRALRRVGGWDAWNVTEDIDLGFRLARFGLAVGWLDSTTFEEAPLTVARWLPQRARWLKGWMVTLMVHTREPRRLFRDLGTREALSTLVTLFGIVATGLLGPPLFAALMVAVCRGDLPIAGGPRFDLAAGASLALAAGGTAALVWPAALGLARQRRLDLLWWSALMPVYLTLLFLAAWRALYELWRDPQGWNKTEHGLARRRDAPRRTKRAPAR